MNLIVFSTINITAEVTGFIIMLILAFALYVNEETKTKQGRAFLLLVVFTAVLYLSDTITWIVDTRPGEWFRTISIITNFMAYLMIGLTSGFYAIYIYLTIAQYTSVSKAYLKAIIVLTGIFLAVLILSQFTGIIYSVDENNVYTHGPFYTVVLVYAVVFLLLVGLFIQHHRKRLGIKNTIVLSTFAYAPLIAGILHFFVHEIMFTHIVLMFTLLIIYMYFQTQQSKQLKLEVAQSQTAIMLSQIQDHFLYNTLTSIEKLCDIDPAKAKLAVNDFAHYLRGNLESLNEHTNIPFIDELEHIEAYLSLEQLRYGDDLQVEYNIEVDEFFVPSLTVQPIVENAIKHGVMKQLKGGTVAVSVRERVDAFVITVWDDGVGFDPAIPKTDGRLHLGIENVRKRLKFLCDGTLEIESAPGAGTTAVITIPKNF